MPERASNRTKADCYEKIRSARWELSNLAKALREGNPESINQAVREVELTSQEAANATLDYIGYSF
jgi:hypothetical protein